MLCLVWFTIHHVVYTRHAAAAAETIAAAAAVLDGERGLCLFGTNQSFDSWLLA